MIWLNCTRTARSEGLFEALQWLEEHLQPMFDATPNDPFPPVRKKGGSNLTRRQLRIIREMSRNGASVAEIARKAKVSRMSVYRHRESPNGSPPSPSSNGT